MVKIVEITRIRSSGCIRLDSGEQYWIRLDDLPASGFMEGAELSDDAFLHQIRICQYPRALNHAVSLLARRPCSKTEIFNRMIRLKYSKEVADLVIYKLEKENLLNDRDFCEQWIRFRLSRNFGSSLIRHELSMKGILEDMIDDAFAKLDPDMEQNGADIQARKAWKRISSVEDPRRSRQKVIASLVRKGYDWDTARSACERVEKETD